MLAAGECVRLSEDSVGDAIGRQILVLTDDLRDAAMAEELSRGVLGVADTVGIEDDHVAGIEYERPFVIGRFLENSERKTRQRNLFALSPVAENRLLLSRVREAQKAAPAIPGGKAESHEAALDQAFAQKSVDGAKHVRGPRLQRAEAAQGSDGDRAVQRGGASLPAHVAESDAQILRAVAEKVIQIAAQLARRDDARGDTQ